MSYGPLKSQDGLSEFVSHSSDSILILKKVLKSSSLNGDVTQDFMNWLQKLIQVGKPNAIKLIRKNYERFNSNEKRFVDLKLDLWNENFMEDYKDE